MWVYVLYIEVSGIYYDSVSRVHNIIDRSGGAALRGTENLYGLITYA